MFDLKQLLDEYEKEKQRQNLVELPAQSLPAPAVAPVEPVAVAPAPKKVVNRTPAVVTQEPSAAANVVSLEPEAEEKGLEKQALLNKILEAYNTNAAAELEKAQASKGKIDLFGALSKAGQRMSAGYASTGGAGMVKSDPTFADEIMKSHNPVGDLKERQTLELKRIADLTKAYKDLNPEQKYKVISNYFTQDGKPLLELGGRFYSEPGKLYTDKPVTPYIDATQGNLAERQTQNDTMNKFYQEKFDWEKQRAEKRNKDLDEKQELNNRDWETNQYERFTKKPAYKIYQDLTSDIKNLEDVIKNPSGYKDMAAIFRLMKTLDPDSVVRESEYKTAANIGSFGTKMANFLQELQSGKKLQDLQRKDILEIVKLMKEIREEGLVNMITPLANQATDRKAKLENILPEDIRNTYLSKRPKSAPKQTTTSNGEELVEMDDPFSGKKKLVPKSRVPELEKKIAEMQKKK